MDETLWHKCNQPTWPRRNPDGRWYWPSAGQAWRRKFNGKWEYRQDPETDESYEGRAW